MQIGLARPALGNPRCGALELQDLRAAHGASRPGDLDGGRCACLGRPHCDELERSGTVRIAVALLVRFVEALGEPGAEAQRCSSNDWPT